MSHVIKRAIGWLTALLLAACAQSPLQQPAPEGSTQLPLSSFRAEGKIAWSQNGKGDSARFVWTYSSDLQKIDLLTPLGSVAATVEVKPERVSLDASDGTSLTAATLEALSLRAFDMMLPLTGMEYWAQGLPVPGSPWQEEAVGDGKRILQRGLVIDYPRWIDVNGHRLPDQIDVHSGELLLKLRIKEWIPHPDAAP